MNVEENIVLLLEQEACASGRSDLQRNRIASDLDSNGAQEQKQSSAEPEVSNLQCH